MESTCICSWRHGRELVLKLAIVELLGHLEQLDVSVCIFSASRLPDQRGEAPGGDVVAVHVHNRVQHPVVLPQQLVLILQN